MVQAEPYFAEPYFVLGAAREAAGELGSAAAAYESFLRLALRHATEEITYARGRLAQLAARKP